MTNAPVIALLCATQSEAAPILSHMQDTHITKAALLEYVCGTLEGMPVVLTCFGIAKTNAAMAAQIAVDRFGAQVIINPGTAGGLDEALDLIDLAVGTTYIHHDLDVKMMLEESYPFYPCGHFAADGGLLEAARFAATQTDRPVHFGPMVSGEVFVDDSNRSSILKRFAPTAVDMESASLAQTCFANGVPFISLRGITDTPLHDGWANYEVNRDAASQAAFEFTCQVLKAYLAE